MPDEVVLSCSETLYQLYVESNISPEKFNISIEAEGEQWCQAAIAKDQNAENSLVIKITSDTYNREDGLGQPLYEPYRTATLHVAYGSVVDKRIKVVQESHVMLLTELDYTSASVLRVSPKGETTEVKVLTKGPDDSINVIDLLSAEKIEELRKRNPPLVFVEIIKNFWCVPSRNPGSIIFSSPKSIPRSFAIFLSNITTAIPLSHPRRRSSNRFPSPSKWSPMRKKLKSSAFSEGRELLRCLDPRQIGSRANE